MVPHLLPSLCNILPTTFHLFPFILFAVNLHLPPITAINPEDKPRFNMRECRTNKWKGDIGELPIETVLPRHPRNVLKIHSRKKRFVAFPKGSSLTVKNSLNIVKHKTDWKQLDLFIGLPFSLDLPAGYLKLIGTREKEEVEEGPVGDTLASSYVAYRQRRSLDQQRKTGFDFIQNTLQSLGLPGKSCLMKAVCESAETPITSLGLLGEMMNMFLSAGYGEGEANMRDFIEAEETGRRNGSCQNLYKECPFDLIDFLESGLSLLHSGVISASSYK